MMPRRRKVVHLTSVHAANDTRIVGKMCATLSKEGYDVVVVAPGPERALPDGVRHRPVTAPRNRAERFLRTIFQVYRAARDERGDVYHFHDPELIGVGIALHRRGTSVIFDVHEDVPLDVKSKAWIPGPLRALVSKTTFVVLRYVQRFFSAIVPATPSIAESFTHPRIVIVRNYPKLDDIGLVDTPSPFESRPLLALYLGSISLLRGVEQIVRAMDDERIPAERDCCLPGNSKTMLCERA